MLPSTPTTQGRVGREVRVRRKTKMLNVSIVIRRGIRNQIVGRREVERKDKVQIKKERGKLKKRKKKRRRLQLRRKRMRKRLTRLVVFGSPVRSGFLAPSALDRNRNQSCQFQKL